MDGRCGRDAERWKAPARKADQVIFSTIATSGPVVTEGVRVAEIVYSTVAIFSTAAVTVTATSTST